MKPTAAALLLATLPLLASNLAAPADGAQAPTAHQAVRNSAQDSALGHVNDTTHRLTGQCHVYRYSYRIHPPTTDWALNTAIVNPHGHRIGTGYFSSATDKTQDHGGFRLCRPGTKPGRYVIRARLVTDDGFDQTTTPIRRGVMTITKKR